MHILFFGGQSGRFGAKLSWYNIVKYDPRYRGIFVN